MKIALDYDGTYTAMPAVWDRFIADVKAAGHEIAFVTMRYPDEPIANAQIPVVYTSRTHKGLAYDANIWIDDNPNHVFGNLSATAL